MIYLHEPLLDALDRGRTLLAPDVRRTRAIRAAYAATQRARGRSVWSTPNVLSLPAWIERELAAASLAGARVPRLLSAQEAWIAWRASALEAARALDIEASDTLIEALQRASELAGEWRIAVEALARTAAGEIESRWLARTMRAFAARCRELRAGSPLALAGALRPSADTRLDLVPAATPTPARCALVAGWREGGADVRRLPPAVPAAVTSVVRARDAADELAAALDWARERLLVDPTVRLLIVVPDLEASRPAVARACAASLTSFAIAGDERLAATPLARHAVTSLRLPAEPLDFDAFSAWLRSPFWAAPQLSERARIDLWLRRRLDVRVSATSLLAALASPPSDLAGACRELRERIEAFVSASDGAPAHANVWAERFVAAFAALGFPGVRRRADPAHASLRETLNELATFDVALGQLTRAAAVDWLVRLIDRSSIESQAIDAAVTVSDALDDPAVRYDGIWITGLTALRWPAAARPEPFIPVRLQIEAGIPQASPAGQLALARTLLDAWRGATDTLVASWPSFMDDAEQAPSALLREFGPLRGGRGASSHRRPADAQYTARALEVYPDHDGVPFPQGAFLPGGSRAVELATRCAFRAYAELRLAALPLERPHPGLDPRDRGRLLHRALELLWGELGDSTALERLGREALGPIIGRSVDAAAGELATEGRGEAFHRHLPRERRRLVRLIASLCELEATRPAFTVLEREGRHTLDLEGVKLRVRVDRVDRLEDGRLALIDYKTGEPKPQDWLAERPAHPQLLVYLRAVGGEVAALASAHLASGRSAYRGLSDRGGRLPRVPALNDSRGRSESPAWPRQVEAWKALVDRALRELAAGRALRDPAPGACVLCHLPTFCRIGDVVTTEPPDE